MRRKGKDVNGKHLLMCPRGKRTKKKKGANVCDS